MACTVDCEVQPGPVLKLRVYRKVACLSQDVTGVSVKGIERCNEPEVPVTVKALGVRLSIDDFGIGYSSLSPLCRIPVDTLKIDRAFISHMDSDPGSREIVRVIINVCPQFRFESRRRGGETEGQINLLKQLDCEMAQDTFSPDPLTTKL